MSWSRRLRGWLQAAHTFPICVVLSLTAVVAVLPGGRIDPVRLALLLLAMLLSQLCIGWTNDYVDRESDARVQPSKPAPSGAVPASSLRVAAWLAGAASLATGALLGLGAWLLLLAGTATGLAYDFGVKDTRLSWLPYVVALALLPAYAWTALGVFRNELAWLYLVAAPLTVAAHLANVFPDLDADRAAGRGGVAVRLGRGRTLALLAACLLMPLLLVAVTSLWLHYEALLAAVLASYAVCGAAAMLCLRSAPRPTQVTGFRLLVVAAVMFTSGWLVAV